MAAASAGCSKREGRRWNVASESAKESSGTRLRAGCLEAFTPRLRRPLFNTVRNSRSCCSSTTRRITLYEARVADRRWGFIKNVPTLPWRSLNVADPERQYLALLSYLPLRHSWQIPHFLLHTARIMGQLRKSRGLLGYSLRAELWAKRFWTLSAWQDETVLQAFVLAAPHSQTMRAMATRMGATRFIRWPVKGSELPISWEEALRRLLSH